MRPLSTFKIFKDSLQLHHDFIPKQLSKGYIFNHSDQRQLLDPQGVEDLTLPIPRL